MKWDKRISLAMATLYISKTVIFEYHYDYIKPQSIKI